jgi:hypothetical protein
MTKKDVENSLGARVMSAKPLLSPKEPKISRTSPPGYEFSAAIKTS